MGRILYMVKAPEVGPEYKWAFNNSLIPMVIFLSYENDSSRGNHIIAGRGPVQRSTRGQGWWPKLPELWVTRTGAPAGHNVIPSTTNDESVLHINLKRLNMYVEGPWNYLFLGRLKVLSLFFLNLLSYCYFEY